MKKLTEQELCDAPRLIQHIYTFGFLEKPIGLSTYEEALEKYPEYFPQEIEHRKKWDAIPQKVHDDYWQEYTELNKIIMKDLPESKGISYYMDNMDEFYEWDNKSKELKKKGRHLYKQLHEKYYSKYGIEYVELPF